MNKRFSLLALLLGLLLITPSALTAQDILIQVYMFQGAWMEGQPGLKQVEILSAASHPEIASIKAKVDSSESELRAAAVETLLKVHDLRTVDDLISFVIPWDGKEVALSEPILHKPAAFRIVFNPKWYLPQTISLQTALYYKEIRALTQTGEAADKNLTKELQNAVSSRQYEKKMEKILDEEIVLGIASPVVISIPYEDRAFFIMIMLTGRPQPIQQVLPDYPEELRQREVKGEAQFRVSIDDEGIVRDIKATKSLHPYLDNAAIQALKQWIFVPVRRKGKTVGVSFNWTIDFDPEKWRSMEMAAGGQETLPGSEPPSRELQKILDGCAEYCKRLAGAALDFICEETTKEINYDIYVRSPPGSSGLSFKTQGGSGNEVITIVSGKGALASDPHRTKINRYVCDYQMVKKGNQIEERRVIIKENGRLAAEGKKMLDEKRFSILKPLFATTKVLDHSRQSLFNFRLLKDDKVQGKVTYVIEAIARPGGASGVQRARIWVDRTNFQILRSEIRGMPAEGYEFIFKDASQFKVNPRFTMTSTYKVEKNGLLFPDHVNVLVVYPWNFYIQSKKIKLESEIHYEKYKFFTVETEHKIIK